MGKTDFVRKCTLTLPVLINFCLNQIKSSLQTELNAFFKEKENKDVPVFRVTSSAFTKARAKFSHSAFVELNALANTLFYEQASIQHWHGFRVLAVDGTKYCLPEETQLKETFGGQSNQHTTTTMALGSCLYDVFQGIVVDAAITHYKSSERELAYQHLSKAEQGDLILYDRGYPAFWLFAAHFQKGVDFCMRVKSNFNKETAAFIQSGEKQATITLTPSNDVIQDCKEKGLPTQAISVRLLRIDTSKGEYVLITSLTDKMAYPIDSFKQLYHSRWQVEEGYKKQKSWLEIENFTGKTPHAIRQDFHARILNLTLAAITAHEATAYIRKSVQHRKALYKINMAQTFSNMKNTLVCCLFGMLNDEATEQWLRTISRSLSIIRLGRSFVRKKKINKGKFY